MTRIFENFLHSALFSWSMTSFVGKVFFSTVGVLASLVTSKPSMPSLNLR